MKTPSETRAILEKLQRQHPDAQTELHYSSAFELLVATILSAQTTDARVNQTTPDLFARFPDARALAGADVAEVERLIKPTGFFRQKAQSITGMAQALVEEHGGEVPASMEALVELPGVGRKTANVVLGHALGVPGLAVDRHVLRVSNRIGIAASDEPEVVEQQLCAALPPEAWTVTSDTLILHGRRVCNPKPLCDRCAVRGDCDFYQSGAVVTKGGPGPAGRRAKGARPKGPAAKARKQTPGSRKKAASVATTVTRKKSRRSGRGK